MVTHVAVTKSPPDINGWIDFYSRPTAIVTAILTGLQLKSRVCLGGDTRGISEIPKSECPRGREQNVNCHADFHDLVYHRLCYRVGWFIRHSG